ncbi:MAG: hybrid sensor histidine kinase/response regulator [Calditrichia bacterium]|nr:hybrid sensor histidine kinase/response regulator [Calditrichota bacterium]MCB0266744.1 hybrid sensor histidine kinase/response regulator [Calditrichota bacterium]MCB9068367.1 hybrid sensor histidine kinase/response regulator [Calditrichia bacterium]
MIDFDPKQVKILIVEDTRESLDLLTYFLKPSGYQLISVIDGVEALEYINKDLPDLILLDVMLPRLNGFQVCERLKKDKRTFHIPIIMITALKDLKDKIRALEAGADDFVTKPFDSVELVARVKSLLKSKFYYDKLKQQNIELERQKNALEEEDRLKEQLTELIAHDMRSPLNQISISLQMIEMMNKSGQAIDSDKYTRRIEMGKHQLLRMILSLLDISRLERGKYMLQPVAINLAFMLRAPIKRYRDLPENKQKLIELQVDKDLRNVYMDSELFERIIDNILDFAYRHSLDKSRIHIDAVDNETDENITLNITYEGKTIPQEFREKLFNKMAQLELKNANIYRSKGLGLYFCKVALTSQGGDITVDRDYDKGLRFQLLLPTKKTNVSVVVS